MREPFPGLAHLSLLQAAQLCKPCIPPLSEPVPSSEVYPFLSVRQGQVQQCTPPLSETGPNSALHFSTWTVLLLILAMKAVGTAAAAPAGELSFRRLCFSSVLLSIACAVFIFLSIACVVFMSLGLWLRSRVLSL